MTKIDKNYETLQLISKVSRSYGVFFAIRFPFMRHVPVLGHYLITWIKDERKIVGSYVIWKRLFRPAWSSIEQALKTIHANHYFHKD